MSQITDRLSELNITPHAAPAPAGLYAPVVRHGDLLFVSGQLSTGPQGDLTGVVGDDLSLDEGRAAARLCALNLLAQIDGALGETERVSQVIRVCGFIRSQDVSELPQVLNGCSELLVEVFGEAGRQARSVVGVSDLPRNCAVEVEAIIAVESVGAGSEAQSRIRPVSRADAHAFARRWQENAAAGRFDVLLKWCADDVLFRDFRRPAATRVVQGCDAVRAAWDAALEATGQATLREVVFDPAFSTLVIGYDSGRGVETSRRIETLRFSFDGPISEIEVVGE